MFDDGIFLKEMIMREKDGNYKPINVVLDLTFEDGYLKGLKDRSREMEAKRGAFKKRYESGNTIQRIEEAFSLDMDLE